MELRPWIIRAAITSLAVIWYFHVKKERPGNILLTGVIPALGGLGMLHRFLAVDAITIPKPGSTVVPRWMA